AAQTPLPGAVSGSVRDDEGAGVVDAAVALEAAAGGATRTLLTDGQGRFLFSGVPPGRYSLRVRRLGFAELDRDVSVASRSVVALELVMRPQAVLLEGVLAEGRRETDRERARFETEPGVTARVVEGASLRVLPGLAEADVLRAVSM